MVNLIRPKCHIFRDSTHHRVCLYCQFKAECLFFFNPEVLVSLSFFSWYLRSQVSPPKDTGGSHARRTSLPPQPRGGSFLIPALTETWLPPCLSLFISFQVKAVLPSSTFQVMAGYFQSLLCPLILRWFEHLTQLYNYSWSLQNLINGSFNIPVSQFLSPLEPIISYSTSP